MKKLKAAIIGQGRSGRDIHGKFFKSDDNIWLDVAAVVEYDPARRELALTEYPGCKVYESYRELPRNGEIDVVINASFSDEHYPITKELLKSGFNVIVEKPFARNYFECCDLIRTAKEQGVMLAVFQQSFLAPFYVQSKALADSGKLGRLTQVSIRYSNLSRRWDWQTMQARMGGSVYNTGPHPIGLALGFLDYSDGFKVEYSKLDRALTSGDAEDYAKIILTAPDKPVVDIEISAVDAFSDYTLKLQGTKGTCKATTREYKMKYIVDGENPPRPLIQAPLKKADGMPSYCSEKLITREESGTFDGNAFNTAVTQFYRSVYEHLTDGSPLAVTPETAAKVIRVIETVHAHNPLPRKY